MRMRSAVIVSVVAIIAALAIYTLIPYIFTVPPPPSGPIPKRITGVPFSYNIEDKVFVNVTEAAEGNAYKQSTGNIEYDKGGYMLLFVPTGIYMGEPFSTEYLDENDALRMHITDSLDPKNGIIEGWMTFNIKNGVLFVSIFLDQDWRNQIKGTTNIIWGYDWDNIEKFEWRSISPGVYMDEISFSAKDFFGKPYASVNVLVSNATLDFIDFPDAFEQVMGFAFT